MSEVPLYGSGFEVRVEGLQQRSFGPPYTGVTYQHREGRRDRQPPEQGQILFCEFLDLTVARRNPATCSAKQGSGKRQFDPTVVLLGGRECEETVTRRSHPDDYLWIKTRAQ